MYRVVWIDRCAVRVVHCELAPLICPPPSLPRSLEVGFPFPSPSRPGQPPFCLRCSLALP